MTIFEQLTRLNQLTQSLLELSQKEAWDDFFILWPSYSQATENLPEIKWLEFTQSEHAQLQTILLEIQYAHVEIINASQTWSAELQDILQKTVQSRKLSDHYR